MSNDTAWEIVFYIDENGRSPVQEFLESLDTKTQVRFEWSMEQLRIRNVQASEPLVKHVEGKIGELRRASRGGIYRLMYFFFTGRRIVFLHGF
jgi:phage-related protein